MTNKSRKKKPAVTRPAKPAKAAVDDQSDFLYWICHPVDLVLPSGKEDENLEEFTSRSFVSIDAAMPYIFELQAKNTPFLCLFGRQVQVELNQSVRVTAGKTVLNVPVPSHEGRSDGKASTEEDDPEEDAEEGSEEGPEGPGAEDLDE